MIAKEIIDFITYAPKDMDYSNHKLEDWQWLKTYREERGEEFVEDFMNRLYSRLMDLPPNSSINIPVVCKEENIDLFIKTCCMFILSNPDYEMSNDYSKIKRL